MSNQPKTILFRDLRKLVVRLRDDLNNHLFVLLYAYNGTGKTRLSMSFKDAGKKESLVAYSYGQGNLIPTGDGAVLGSKEIVSDTLYFNAFTEDLFSWDNDLENDKERVLKINASSKFFDGFKELALEEKIFAYLERYADFDFKIDYDDWKVIFSKGEQDHIKVSRGEENIFIWCVFLSICELVIEDSKSYEWVKYVYIDDPISSLDDNNAIAVASDLAQLLKKGKDRIKTVISSHHSLFFNVICNELKQFKHKRYFLYKNDNEEHTLRPTDDTPFFHHVAILSELNRVKESRQINTYHFNMLRSILEKTSTFFGFNDFSDCIKGIDDDVLYSRALNLLSHGKYSVYEPVEMGEDNKELFIRILQAFQDKYKFELPELLIQQTNESQE